MADLQHLFSRVFRFALNMTHNRESAEDIAQETFLRAARNNVLEECIAVGPAEDTDMEVSWLFRVARNLWLDQLKSAATKKRAGGDFGDPQDNSPESTPELIEEVAHAMEMMKLLPDTQRQVLFLHAVEEMKIVQIAESLDMTSNSVKVNLSLARKTMRQKCDPQFETRG